MDNPPSHIGFRLSDIADAEAASKRIINNQLAFVRDALSGCKTQPEVIKAIKGFAPDLAIAANAAIILQEFENPGSVMPKLYDSAIARFFPKSDNVDGAPVLIKINGLDYESL